MDHKDINMTLLIRPCSIHEIENSINIDELLKEYGEESAIRGLPQPSAQMVTYRQFEAIGAIYVIGAFIDNLLIGFITILSPTMPHYGVRVAASESFFVLKAYRKTGAGLKILKAAENYAKEILASGILITAPLGSNLAEVLPHVGYVETNRVFFRNFNNE
jgi:GNAT superfamily N-acetyltransferase